MNENKVVKKNNKIIAVLIAAIAISLGAGFFGGLTYQKTKKVTSLGDVPPGMQQGITTRNGNATSRNRVPGSGSQPVSGEITSIDDMGITVKTPNGGSKIIVFSSSTVVNKTAEGDRSDLKTGENVMIIGTEGSDGTVTAESVSIGVIGLQFQGGNNPTLPQDN